MGKEYGTKQGLKMQKLSKKQHEAMYAEIAKFYDLADNIIDAIEDSSAPDPDFQAIIAAPVLEQIDESVNILEDCYINFVQSNNLSKKDSRKAEDSLKALMESVLEFLEEIKAVPGAAVEKVSDVELSSKKTTAILQKLVDDVREVFGSPLMEAFRAEAARLKEFKQFIESVMHIALQTMFVSRAMQALKMIVNLKVIEPAKEMARIISMQQHQSFASRVAGASAGKALGI